MLFKKIESQIGFINIEEIPSERKKVLQPLIDYIQDKTGKQQEIRLNFICTHNSRRSHLAQVWAQTLAAYFGIKNTYCYSGGTEATALYPMVAETLEASGFSVQQLSKGENPIYSIKYDENEQPIIGFSKTFDNGFNPKSEFAAIMTCSHAEANCPFIAGAEKRIAIPYDDPKAFDGTPLQKEKYQERNIQIASELYYVFSKIIHKK